MRDCKKAGIKNPNITMKFFSKKISFIVEINFIVKKNSFIVKNRITFRFKSGTEIEVE